MFLRASIHGIALTYFRELVSVKKQRAYNLRSLSNGLSLATPAFRARVTLGDIVYRSFYFAAPKLWNALPSEIRSLTDVRTFKCHLNTYLFKKAFY